MYAMETDQSSVYSVRQVVISRRQESGSGKMPTIRVRRRISLSGRSGIFVKDIFRAVSFIKKGTRELVHFVST